MANAAGDDVVVADFAFGFWSGAEWFAAGMAVCAFLEDLADLHAAQRGPDTKCAACDETRGRHCATPPPPGVVCMECCGEFREVTP
jgi:hypothetical protein